MHCSQLRRAGRFEHEVELRPPTTVEARLDILRAHAARIPLAGRESAAASLASTPAAATAGSVVAKPAALVAALPDRSTLVAGSEVGERKRPATAEAAAGSSSDSTAAPFAAESAAEL